MKSAVERIREYREYPALNYSLLKAVIEGNFHIVRKPSIAFDLGSLVDCFLTTEEHFDEMFSVLQSRPGTKPKLVVDSVFDSFSEIPEFQRLIEEHPDAIFRLLDHHEYRTSYKDPKDVRRLAKFIEESKPYYEELLKVGDKTIVSELEVQQCKNVASSIKSGRYTTLFHFLDLRLTVRTQVALRAVIDGIEYKCLLDKLIMNETESPISIGNYILLPGQAIVIDYKTTGFSTRGFQKQIFKLKYHIQASLYSRIVKEYLPTYKPGMTVADFMFIVESTKFIGQPLVYRVSDNDLAAGEFGAEKTTEGYKVTRDLSGSYMGWRQATELYLWHKEREEWEYPKSIVDRNGMLTTNIFSQ